MQYTNWNKSEEPSNGEAVELEHIISLIDDILHSLCQAPWAYDRDGTLLDREVFHCTLDGPQAETESPESLKRLENSLKLREEFQKQAEKSPFSFLEYEEIKCCSVTELSAMSWKEVEEKLLKEEKWRVLAILRKGSCAYCSWKVPESVPDEKLLQLVAFRYGDMVERMKYEEEFRSYCSQSTQTHAVGVRKNMISV